MAVSVATARLRRAAASAAARPRAVAALRTSPLFDQRHYERRRGQRFTTRTQAIVDYLTTGEPSGLDPHPLVDLGWYVRSHAGAGTSRLGPLAHLQRRGAARGEVPHPVIDPTHYLAAAPGAASHPGGILGHYLTVGRHQGLELNAWFDSAAYRAANPELPADVPAIVAFVQTVRPVLDAVADHRDFPRSYPHFDHAAAEAFVAATLAAGSPPDAPLVSVIVPTRDRADLLPRAVRSALAQTYPHLEVLVVDDGSTDDTLAVLAAIDDDRLRVLTQPPTGVCRARNAGLAAARGQLVAYLDSDNAWEPRFLAVMVAFLHQHGLAAAYSALELDEGEGRTAYRGAALHREALREANYIDINTVVHDRDLADRLGGWDESLRRTNDWDYLLRLADVTDLGYAPFIGVRYDHDPARGDRITVREPGGYQLRVRAKHLLDWPAAAAADVDPALTSIVIASAGHPDVVTRCVDAVVAHTDPPYEIVLVDHGRSTHDGYRLQALAATRDHVRVVRHARDLFDSLGPNVGITQARGATVVMLHPTTLVTPGWLAPLLVPVAAGTAAATAPLVLADDSLVDSAGVLVPVEGLPAPAFRGLPEHAPEVRADADRQALTGRCLVVRRADLVAVEGFDARYRVALQDLDLTLRLSMRTGRPCRYVAGSTVIRGPGRARQPSQAGWHDEQVFRSEWTGRLTPDEPSVLAATGLRRVHAVLDRDPDAFGAPLHRPVLARVREHPPRRRWALKIGPRLRHDRHTWGDWHFAQALQAALEELGQQVVIDLRGVWYRDNAQLDDVVVQLRGVVRYLPNPHHVNLLWVISHPDPVTAAELAPNDHVFVASSRLARRFATETTVPVEPLLQCTDPDRFRPDIAAPSGPSVLFVGNSRKVVRPVVRDAVAAGLPLTIHGADWEGLVPDTYVAGSYLANEDLPAAYRGAGVVLNDHWDDMRRQGLLSNRLFDLAACGARIISDPCPGIEEVFGDLIRIHEPGDAAGLATLVAEVGATAAQQDPARRELAARVREAHSFRARAARLLEVAERRLREREADGHG